MTMRRHTIRSNTMATTMIWMLFAIACGRVRSEHHHHHHHHIRHHRATTAADDNNDPVAVATDLSPLLNAAVEQGGLVGVAAFVASRHGVCAVGSAGVLAATQPLTPVQLWNSPWYAGSLTKSLTASLAALLVADETVPLEWTTTLGQVFAEAEATAYENVTLEKLLGHRGGFRRNIIASNVSQHLSELIATAGGAVPWYLTEQRRAVVLYGLNTPPVVPTNETGNFQYSNLGYVIAAGLMENVTGVAWEDLMVSRLFVPLGMESAYFGCPDTASSPFGHHYVPETGLLHPVAPTKWCDCISPLNLGCDCLSIKIDNVVISPLYAAPVSHVYMQLSDWVRYYQWHMLGESGEDVNGLLSQADFQRLHTGIGGEINGGDLYTGTPYTYGHGWATTRDLPTINGTVLWHGGTNGLWNSAVLWARGADRIYFIATNAVQSLSGESLAPVVNAVIANMTLTAFDGAMCPPIETLDQRRDPGSHDACLLLVYGPSAANTSIGDDPDNSSTTGDASDNDSTSTTSSVGSGRKLSQMMAVMPVLVSLLLWAF